MEFIEEYAWIALDHNDRAHTGPRLNDRDDRRPAGMTFLAAAGRDIGEPIVQRKAPVQREALHQEGPRRCRVARRARRPYPMGSTRFSARTPGGREVWRRRSSSRRHRRQEALDQK